MAALLELFLGSSSAPVDWEAEAYPAYADFAVLPFLVAFFPAVRYLLDRLVFEVISCFLHFFFGGSWIRIVVVGCVISLSRIVVSCGRTASVWINLV